MEFEAILHFESPAFFAWIFYYILDAFWHLETLKNELSRRRDAHFQQKHIIHFGLDFECFFTRITFLKLSNNA